MSTAAEQLRARAVAAGCDARLINHPEPGKRVHQASGSRYSPQRVLVIDGVSFSLGGARQYIAARERRAAQ